MASFPKSFLYPMVWTALREGSLMERNRIVELAHRGTPFSPGVGGVARFLAVAVIPLLRGGRRSVVKYDELFHKFVKTKIG